jgi:hypothetical protein
LGGAEDDVKDNERACGAPMFDNLQDRLMFDNLQDRLGEVFERLKRRGALSESDVTAALREVRVALLEADVALPVVKDFVEAVREKALGQEVLRSVTPGQMVVKIVHDHLVETLGREAVPLTIDVTPPAVFLLVGLQGSGKTTTTAKIALRLKNREKKKALMASLDVRRRRRPSWPRSTCGARRPRNSSPYSGPRRRCARSTSFRASRRSPSRAAPCRRRRSKATTRSCWTPPGGSPSTRS